VTLTELNALPEEKAVVELLRCCGCAAWASAMARKRPFASKDALLAAADEEWSLAGPTEWLEAFAHHPRIGGKDALRAKFASTVAWAKGEQAGAAAADEATLDGLAKGNEEYEKKNGFIFIVCATGKTANEMLSLLNKRLPNERDQEMRISAAEQSKITKIRLEKLIS
jgi:2-oxo-4-hydroxy-4-carboxy-5-ureidoimidazoline decarboxylase